MTLLDRNGWWGGYQPRAAGPSSGVLDGVSGREYDGVWRAWKLGSLGLFALFVLVLADAARSLRRLERRRASCP